MRENPENRRSKAGGHFATAVRAIVPAVPLGLALIHGAIAPSHHPPLAVPIAQHMAAPTLDGCDSGVPCPLMSKGHPVMWWFVFKLNAKSFPGCGGGTRSCPFGGEVRTGPTYSKFGQQYLVANNDSASL